MKRVFLNREQVFTGTLILVNKEHPIRKTIGRQDLRAVGKGVRLQREAALQLKFLLGEQRDIVSVSGFRSHQEQKNLYQQSLHDNGEIFTGKYVALPRCSEHECGLAIDLGENKEPVDEICPSFPYTGPCQDFRNRAPYFGFVQRYEKGKEDATGIAHEPWHFRYVGFPHSLIMQERNLSLEEYLQLLHTDKRLVWNCGMQQIEIQYVPVEGEKQEASIPADRPCQISGDNERGIILTIW